MPFLVVGPVTVPVAIDAISEEEAEEVGSDSRAYAGNLRTTVRAVKRKFKVTTKPIPQADYVTLRTAVISGQHVVCSGDALGGNITCRVKVSATYKKVRNGFRRIVTLTLREV